MSPWSECVLGLDIVSGSFDVAQISATSLGIGSLHEAGSGHTTPGKISMLFAATKN